MIIISPQVTAKISKGLSEVFLLIEKLIPWHSQEIQAPAFTNSSFTPDHLSTGAFLEKT